MKLPNGNLAYVPPEKLRRYLLSATHPVGGSKARWLQAVGFRQEDVASLEAALTAVARDGEVHDTRAAPSWVLYSVDGALLTPSGEAVAVRTVWALEQDDDRPRFITAYPLRRPR